MCWKTPAVVTSSLLLALSAFASPAVGQGTVAGTVTSAADGDGMT